MNHIAKPAKKAQARSYREQGKSITWMAKTLHVSKSSVSTWTRDIKLTEAQEMALRFSNERREAQVKGAEANVKNIVKNASLIRKKVVSKRKKVIHFI